MIVIIKKYYIKKYNLYKFISKLLIYASMKSFFVKTELKSLLILIIMK